MLKEVDAKRDCEINPQNYDFNRSSERGGGQTFTTFSWMRFCQARLCRYRFKVIFDGINFLRLGTIIEYNYMLLTFQFNNYDTK